MGKRYMCYMNFPRCDDEGKSLILCRSVCENYAHACGISKDLNRCGPNEFYGAEKPEQPELDPETKKCHCLFGENIQDGHFEIIKRWVGSLMKMEIYFIAM